jgi:GNAT superfamily N-acetyltransferase
MQETASAIFAARARKIRAPPGNPGLICRMEMTIAPVTPAEIPTLLELIRELARFEKLEHEVEATAESLHQALFGPQPAAGALLARVDGEAAGYAIYFSTFSSFTGRAGLWLDDLYVQPAFRRRGLGRRLMEAVARIGVERGCGRFEWMALDWNERALEFYRGLGARTLDDWVLLRVKPTELRRLAAE